jgi:hypothetical protein
MPFRPNQPSRDELASTMSDGGKAQNVNFFGEGGIIRMGKKALLDEAKRLRAEEITKGATGAEARGRVYQGTGLYTQRNVPGKLPSEQWKMETPSFQARLTGVDPSEFGPGKFDIISRPLGELLDYPSLFEGDPSLADLRATLNIRQPGTRTTGGYRSWLDPKSPGFSRPSRNYDDPIYVTGGSHQDMMDTLLHEIQHSIQHREGFPEGWSTQGQYGTTAAGKFDEMQKIAQRRRAEVLQGEPEMDTPAWFEWQMNPEVQRLLGGYSSIAQGPGISGKPYMGYKLSAGEIEANNAAQRARTIGLLSPDEQAAAQRLQTPWTTQEYPEDITWRSRF